MKNYLLPATLALAACAFAANAKTTDLSWNYVSAGYARLTADDIGYRNIELNGQQYMASYALTDIFFMQAKYLTLKGNFDVSDMVGLPMDTSELGLSLGMRQPIYASGEAFIQAGYSRSKVGIYGYNETSSNLQASTGVRFKLVADLELSGALSYTNGDNSDSNTFADLTARYMLTPMFDVYVNYQYDSDTSLFGGGVSLHF